MAVSYLKVGYNFTSDLEEYILSTHKNNNFKNAICEVYGSRAESSLLSARPKFRIPEVKRSMFKEHVRNLAAEGISFNYTLNANAIGTKKEIKEKMGQTKDYIRFLVDCGVGCITVSLPIIAQWIREVSSEIKIEVSTIAHINTVTQAKLWHETFGINKICGNLHKNRDFAFLQSLSSYCHSNEIDLVLMANEFCGNGVRISNSPYCSASNCIFRDHCYQLHSLDYNESDILDEDYPMGYCISSRDNDAVWLKMNFIRPEDLAVYNAIGINNFKITGRTGSTAFIKNVTQAYLQGSYQGNLLDLWKHLETIDMEKDADYMPKNKIPNTALDGFIDFWTHDPYPVCANEICGVSCDYCDKYFHDRILMNRK